MRYLGIDYGKKRVGVALSDPNGEFALAHSVLPNDEKLLANLKQICDENSVEHIVIGESKDYKMKDNPIMKQVGEFKITLADMLKLPISLEPEFMTSMEAERLQGKNEMLDASAAALILKSFLDKKN